jgi:NAD(P)-dependent dehydrogenase (short-subunit alcohol dehydrogenase family)
MQVSDTGQWRTLVVGANRGLGLGLTDAMLRMGWTVIGTSRKGTDGRALHALSDEYPGALVLEHLDLGNPVDLDEFSTKVSGPPLDLVIFNGATSGPVHRSVTAVTLEECGQLFFVNSLGPVRLAHLLVDKVLPEKGVFAFISSVQGSVERNQNGANALYRASKAALNSLSRSFFMSTGSRFAVLSLHPGWVKTSMGGADATVEIEDSAVGLLEVIRHHRGDHAHRYLDYLGATIPW